VKASSPDASVATLSVGTVNVRQVVVGPMEVGRLVLNEQYGHIPLIGQAGKAVIGEALNVIHHPSGERKRVSIRFNRFVSQDDLWVRYESDSREGSSGAPVFNDQWEMVALYHGGISATGKEGFELARDGRRWTEDMGEDALAYVGNEGARVSRIVRSLSEAAIPAEHRDLVARS